MLLYNEVGNIDLFQMWYYSSQYSNLLKPFLDTFPNQQVHVALFDDLKLNPRYFLESVFKFIGVDETFEPSILQKRVNSGDRGVVTRKSNAGIFSALFKKQTDTQKLDEYQLGVPPQVEARLLKKFHNEIEKLELLIDQDLTHWKTSKNGN